MNSANIASVVCGFVFFVNACFAKQTIILIDGLSSSGKTSICSAFKSDNEKWAWIDQDEILYQFFAQKLKEHFPYEYLVLSQVIKKNHLFHAVRRKQIRFKQLTTDLSKLSAIKVIDKLHEQFKHSIYQKLFVEELKLYTYTLIDQLIGDQKDILLDSWLFTNAEDVEILQELAKTYCILVYCPLDEMIKRVKSRKESAVKKKDIVKHRFVLQSIKSFSHYFYYSKQEEGALEKLTLAAIQEAFAQIHQNPYLFFDESLEEILTLKLELTQKIKEKNCYIHPPELPYDLIIHSHQFSPKESAKMIDELIHTINKNKLALIRELS